MHATGFALVIYQNLSTLSAHVYMQKGKELIQKWTFVIVTGILYSGNLK